MDDTIRSVASLALPLGSPRVSSKPSPSDPSLETSGSGGILRDANDLILAIASSADSRMLSLRCLKCLISDSKESRVVGGGFVLTTWRRQ